MKDKIINVLKAYNIDATITHVITSAAVTRYIITLPIATRLSKLKNRLSDIERDLQVNSIRLVQENAMLILEIANVKRKTILFKDVYKNPNFRHNGQYNILLGMNLNNKLSTIDLRKLPHLLIAGATGSGKSVGIHSILCSLLVKNSPKQLELLLIDPKKTELSFYNGLPHLLTKEVITENEEASNALAWAIDEMENRYTIMNKNNVRDVTSLNLSTIVIIIDELADLILSGDKSIIHNLIRLAQKARACGIHIIAATQRPSSDVITGLIKANFPARLCYRTASKIDSRIILDQNSDGASLLGNGDSLFHSSNGTMQRVQSAYITDNEINTIVSHCNKEYKRVRDCTYFNECEEITIQKNNTWLTNGKMSSYRKWLYILIILYLFTPLGYMFS